MGVDNALGGALQNAVEQLETFGREETEHLRPVITVMALARTFEDITYLLQGPVPEVLQADFNNCQARLTDFIQQVQGLIEASGIQDVTRDFNAKVAATGKTRREREEDILRKLAQVAITGET
jgi:hypothetical protein